MNDIDTKQVALRCVAGEPHEIHSWEDVRPFLATAVTLFREWMEQCNNENNDLEYIATWLTPRTGRWVNGTGVSQSNDFNGYDFCLSYRFYHVHVQWHMVQVKSKWNRKVFQKLRDNKPEKILAYLCVYNQPPKKVIKKENIITLPYGSSTIKMWAIEI